MDHGHVVEWLRRVTVVVVFVAVVVVGAATTVVSVPEWTTVLVSMRKEAHATRRRIPGHVQRDVASVLAWRGMQKPVRRSGYHGHDGVCRR